MLGSAGTLVKDVNTQFEDQGKRLMEVNRDLAVFKNAHFEAEQKNKALMEQLKVRFRSARLFRLAPPQFYVMSCDRLIADCSAPIQTIEAREKRVVVLIDGDGAIFLPSLIAEGKQGGHEAASRLTTEIKAHLGPQQFKLHVYVFLNRRGLTVTLKRHGHVEAAAMFDEFLVGFNQAAERFAMIDAGELKEGSDHKIRGATLFLPDLTAHRIY
jgi:hypothetical protein